MHIIVKIAIIIAIVIVISKAMKIAFMILCVCVCRNETQKRGKLYAKEYQINLVDGTYYITADSEIYGEAIKRMEPYIKDAYAATGKLLTKTITDLDLNGREGFAAWLANGYINWIIKKRIKKVRKCVGGALSKLAAGKIVTGYLFSYTFAEYYDYDIRQVIEACEKQIIEEISAGEEKNEGIDEETGAIKNAEMSSVTKAETENICDVSFATDEEVVTLGSVVIEENREAFEELAK